MRKEEDGAWGREGERGKQDYWQTLLENNIVSTIIVTQFKTAQFKIHNEVYFNCEIYRFWKIFLL